MADSSVAYYPRFSDAWVTIVGDPSNRHNFQPVHDSKIVRVNKVIDKVLWKYLAYDSDNIGSEIRLYMTNDLNGQWVAYSGNPILGTSSNHYRWPSVVWDGSTFHMFLDDRTDTEIERWTSTDGINFSFVENMTITTETDYMSPFVWKNPNDGLWYLYHQENGDYPNKLWGRSASTIAGLATAIDTEILTWSGSGDTRPAAASMMYWNTKYWLVTEDLPSGAAWCIRARYGDSPTGSFTVGLNSAILGEGYLDGHACPIHLKAPFGDGAYLYTTPKIGGQWYARSFKIYPVQLIKVLRPNGVGDETAIQSTNPLGQPHWQMIDDVTPDDATTTIWQLATGTNRDLYALEDFAETAELTIRAIIVIARADYAAAGVTGYWYPSIKTYGVTYDGPAKTIQYAQTEYGNVNYTWTVNPYTKQPWTKAELNDLQAGVKIVKSSGSGYITVTQLWTVVEYEVVEQTVGNWNQLKSIMATNAKLAEEERKTKELECPQCGYSPVDVNDKNKKACQWCGWQS